jgi:hypothetical protein
VNVFAWTASWLWWSLLAVGSLASLAGVLTWYFREVSQRRLPAPRFFLIALGVHVLLATGSFYVYLDNGAGAQIRRSLHRIVAAARLPLEKLHASLRPADDGFGKVADLKPVTAESPVAGPSLTVRPPRLSPADMTAPVEPLARMLPAARFAAPPGEAIASLDLRQLPHRRAVADVGSEPIEIQPLRAAGQPSSPQIEGVAVGEDHAAAADAPPAVAAAMLAGPAGPASEPLGRMSPAAGFEAPSGEMVASLDLHGLPHRRGVAAVGSEPIEIQPVRAAGQPSLPRIEGVAVGEDRATAAGAPPATAAAMLAGPATEPLPAAAGSAGKGAPTGMASDNFVPLAVTKVPRLNRALRPAAPVLPEARADMEALSAPAGGAGHGAGTGSGQGPDQRAGAFPGGVDVSRPDLPSAPAPRAVDGGPAGGGDAAGLAGWPRRLGQGSAGSGFPGGDGVPGSVAALGMASGTLPADRLARRGPRAPSLMYAEDSIGLQAMFRMRQSEDKQDLATAAGATSESLAAVHRGLEWLVEHQHPDGYWSLQRFYQQTPGRRYGGAGSLTCDVAATGFALLPLLGDGHTQISGQHQPAVSRGLGWMLTQQKPDGELSGKYGHNCRMYAHAIASIVLCEAYGMTKDPKLRDPAQRALDFIVAAQHKSSGGWRYSPRQAADMSVVGWQVMAMKSGQMAALNVSQDSLDLVHKWLQSVEGKGARVGTFEYTKGYGITPAMTAEGLLCLEYLGAQPGDPRLQSGVKYLLGHLPRKGQETGYYWYYGTQVMYHVQGDAWRQWNLALRDMLVATQVKTGDLAGTWDPADQWDHQAGRIYASSLRLLALEVYFRHLPLYRLSEP